MSFALFYRFAMSGMPAILCHQMTREYGWNLMRKERNFIGSDNIETFLISSCIVLTLFSTLHWPFVKNEVSVSDATQTRIGLLVHK
jgi:hypothetical protein